MAEIPSPLTACQRQEIKNLFKNYTAQQLGLEDAQYAKLYNDQKVLNKSPEEIFMKLENYREANQRARRRREQDAEMAKAGFTATLTPLKENVNRRVEVTYNESESACRNNTTLRSSLGKSKYKKGKKRSIQIHEGTPEYKHYVPGKKIRDVFEDEPEQFVVKRGEMSYWRAKDRPRSLCEQSKSKANTSTTVKKNVMRPRYDPEGYEPAPDECHTPKKNRHKTKRTQITKEEKEEDKAYEETYLNPIRIPASAPIQDLANLPSGSVIQIIPD